jgi:hypothetical protein
MLQYCYNVTAQLQRYSTVTKLQYFYKVTVLLQS